MKFDDWTVLSGAAGGAGFFFFSAQLDAVADDTPSSTFFLYDEDNEEDGGFSRYDEIVGWPAIAMATIKPAGGHRLVVAVSPSGESWELDPATGDERCATVADRVTLRALAVIEGGIYACGMNRAVLKRDDVGRWRAMGPGAEPDDPPVVGFQDLGGSTEAELYAVGWGGEIWWRDRGTWRRVDSPTKANLTALCCAPDGTVYVVGHDGVMLRGRKDEWRLVETTRRETLRDVAILDGVVYAVSDFAIYRLGEAGLEPDPDLVDDAPATCLGLLEVAGGLVSLGPKDVLTKTAGGPWRRVL